jgi:hypothetical protein
MGRSACDLIGLQFGRLVVVNRVGNRNRQSAWRCRCKCGGTTIATRGALKQGGVRSCGCLRREAHLINLTGRTVASYRVIGRAENRATGGRARWLCRCVACGSEKTVDGWQLRAGKTRCTVCPKSLARQDWSGVIAPWEPKPRQPKPQGRPPTGSRVLVKLAGEPRWIAALGENELREVALFSKAQACRVSRERKRRALVEDARRPPGRPCKDPEREAERVAAWKAAGRPQSWVVKPPRNAPPASPPAPPRPSGHDRLPEMPLLQRLALIAQNAEKRRGALAA